MSRLAPEGGGAYLDAMASASAAETALWRADDLDAELLRARFSDYAYDLHSHDTACLALITAGAIDIRMKDGRRVVRAGELYAIDADELHAGVPVDAAGWSQRTIYLDIGRLRARVSDGRDGALVLAGPVIRDPALNRLFLDVHRLSEADARPLARDQRYLDFAAWLLARHTREPARLAPAGREPAAVRRARAFLDARIAERVHLGDVAAAAGLPPFRLYRAFVRATGITPHAYQRQARFREAVRRIRAGEPLAEVAAAAGFADQAHLTRSFFRRMGVTPGAYRDALL
ncbi:AraC family transcriptional regulator [uncultured Alphaproteobacteria bacterium]|uniref:AraC family transcriptional regulator n=1 Tax=uncultured Alphaproteobacteria bacterium TaxID=91750 RepID=A0A212JQW7_9PROT|nr:AraC family transcriptional regulator [uncultured Alphaproteobacteria bacterium]